MQRLVDKIVNEFQQNCDYVELYALDGNGDSFVVFQGSISKLTVFPFANILRHPSCFYFFTASAIPFNQPDLEDSVLQRDICWLTDPAPPYASARSHHSISVSWPFVSFCGITPPVSIETVQYILEIAEGVEHKPGYFTKFVSDVCAVDYKLVCAGPNINSTTINGLRPGRWYHLRLSIEYLGTRFTSDTESIFTSKWSPSPPSIPRVQIIPVASTFDLKDDRPVRLDMSISWYSANHNGSKITSYQLQVQRFDREGCVVESIETKQKSQKRQAMTGRDKMESPERDKRANQWTQSHGRSALQIHNSMVLGKRSPVKNRSLRLEDKDSGDGGRPQSSSSDKLTTSLPPLENATSPERRYKWEIVYDSMLTSMKCSSPSQDQSEWHMRVRARNAEGWSDFGPMLKINSQTHPSLFSLPPPENAYGTHYYTARSVQNFMTGHEAENYEQDIIASQQQASQQPPASQIRKSITLREFEGPMDQAGNINLEEKSLYSPTSKPPTPKHVLHFKQGTAWDAPADEARSPKSYSTGTLPKVLARTHTSR